MISKDSIAVIKRENGTEFWVGKNLSQNII